MRRRKRKGFEERLLSNSDYVINGMVELSIENSDKVDNNFNKFDYRTPIEDEVYNNIKKYRGSWNKVFKNENPIYLEVGSGRGQFITTLAQLNPDINFIALEIKEEVLLRALEKAIDKNLNNIIFLWGSVEMLDLYFDDRELSRIYINFCDPWPKKRNAKKRLTHGNFLELYRLKLADGEIHFKTDSKELFEFSLNQFSENDWKLKNITLDLENSDFKENVETEYEEKFRKLGKPIYRLEAKDNRR
ncbi:tRNA (guanosine(46)-N7)-methyltransferase TrmB [Peptostreptococcus faecalis]|uniref:tRNA (guanosine(46)-N7)-methyltransferase TrmB n=1 Tax=Peptostreptococcus faecalis TaxID=2045015 RepID=UPI000C7A6E4E|nr:tRNA (guanosine(46)-N7)-methyltransferase TrmB [Peptostreptococcus faecalis]